MDMKHHWEEVYKSKSSEKLGWYVPRLQTSIKWIKELPPRSDAKIIDVGSGASTLVDDLLELRYKSLTVLDISEEALSLTRKRLAEKAELVTWLIGDVTTLDLSENEFDIWHDRAVFHFLTETERQNNYLNSLKRALKPGGHLIIGTFAPEAPPKCSGLAVQRYTAEQLMDTLGTEFELERDHRELHITPSGVEQMYTYCQLIKLS